MVTHYDWQSVSICLGGRALDETAIETAKLGKGYPGGLRALEEVSSTATDDPGGITMPRHHHTAGHRARRYGAVLAGAVLTLVTRRGRHQSRHRRGHGRYLFAGARFGPSRHRAGRRGRRLGRWAR
jgi:hypothetical protein